MNNPLENLAFAPGLGGTRPLPAIDAFVVLESTIERVLVLDRSWHVTYLNPRALEYISTGQVPVKDLITRHIPLDDVLEAFQIVKNGEAIKVTVEP